MPPEINIADLDQVKQRVLRLEDRIYALEDGEAMPTPIPDATGGASGYSGPFRIYVDGTSINIDSGYITRIGVPRVEYPDNAPGTVGPFDKILYCSIEYQTTGSDTVSFGIGKAGVAEEDGGIPLESRNLHVIVLADISATGIVYQRHFGDIEYIHFDRCVSCT